MKIHCPCSTRALEVFVNGLTGLSISQTASVAARRAIYPQRRTFATNLGYRQLNQIASAEPDDSFVPFDTDDHDTPTQTLNSHKRLVKESQGDAKERDELHDEWHAEVKIAAPWPQQTNNAGPGKLVRDATLRDSGETALHQSQNLRSVDQVSLEGLHEQSRPEEQGQDVPVVPPDTVGAITPPPLPSPQPSKAENRQQRKLRRLQAGTYKVQASTRIREERSKAQVDSVLKLMRAMKSIPAKEEAEQGGKDSIRMSGRSDASSTSDHQALPRQRTAVDERKNVANKTQSVPLDPAVRQTKSKLESWAVQKNSLKQKFGEQGWQPRKRLSPDTLDGIRALHASDPSSYTTELLADHFKVAPEAIRRILKSKWRPSDAETEDRRVRWERRGERKWQAMAEQGTRPPAKWRAKGIKTPQAKAKRSSKRRREDHARWDDRGAKSKGSSLAERI